MGSLAQSKAVSKSGSSAKAKRSTTSSPGSRNVIGAPWRVSSASPSPVPGVISLAGVVVNNTIVLIDYYNKLMQRGLSYREALVQTGLTRFRPVMLTAITTILGLLPLATGFSFDFRKFAWNIGGESTQWWGPMAVAVIFGLGVATLLTLVVVPVLCSLAHSLQTRLKSQT
ncbi:MAG: efflux RND transporter permease subunit [Deltaproteobacteria bacterium]|nr:efflux RND transporter permease subunit [Deltaproteobacteria bacterium]